MSSRRRRRSTKGDGVSVPSAPKRCHDSSTTGALDSSCAKRYRSSSALRPLTGISGSTSFARSTIGSENMPAPIFSSSAAQSPWRMIQLLLPSQS